MSGFYYTIIRSVTFEEAKYICNNIFKIKGNYATLYPCEREDLIDAVNHVIRGEESINLLDIWNYCLPSPIMNDISDLLNFLAIESIIKFGE